LLSWLALALFGLLLAELAVRGWLALGGQAYRAAACRAELAARGAADLDWSPDRGPALEQAFDPQLPHPFVAFETEREEQTFRAELAALTADPAALDARFTVLVIGGSVSKYFADPVNGGLEPLRERLASDPRSAGRELLFLNHGRDAFKQPQQLFWFLWVLSLGLEPDLLINLDGFNETAITALNAEQGAHPLYPMASRWAIAVEAGRTSAVLERAASVLRMRELAELVLRHGLERSAIVGTAVRARMDRLDRQRARAEERALAELDEDGRSALFGPAFDGTGEQAVERAVEAWATASRVLHEVCRARGIRYLHVLQPTLHDEGSKPLSEEERRNGRYPEAAEAGVRHGYPLLRAAGARLVAEGVPFLDASSVFADVEQTLYFDGCHFRRPGTEILGRAVAAAL
jgi:hypothetical protein